MTAYLRHRILAALLVLGSAFVLGWVLLPRTADEATSPTTPEAALKVLRNGNQRFVHCCRTRSTDTLHDAERRQQTAQGQHPFAAVLCCSDSRVCPEFIFDQQAGSIFEVRNAGNVVDEDVLASLEYAVEHLHVPLIVILGHKRCGAIEAVCEAGERPLPDHLQALQKHMAGIHKQVIECHRRHNAVVVDRLALENARQQAVIVLNESTPISRAVNCGLVRVVYGLYDLESGIVEFFELDNKR